MQLYFSGIGGSGLAPLAMLARDCGFDISGSDKQASFGTDSLIKQGIIINFKQSYTEIQKAHSLKPIDWIIISSSLPKNHPHIEFAKNNNIKISKRSKLINHIIKIKKLKLIAISGTHGKTTTTAMAAWLFKQLAIPVSYLIGSQITFGKAGAWEQNSKYFVLECDEFDRNFLDFKPDIAVIPSLDYDHPDTYPTPETYTEAFRQFTQQSKLTILFKETWKKLNLENGLVDDLKQTSQYLIVDKKSSYDGHIIQDEINLPGKHNRENALLAFKTLFFLAPKLFKKDQFQVELVRELIKILNDFPGTSRRFEKIGYNIYSDYAHGPAEIAATISLATEILKPNQKIIIIYQPHQNIRQHAKSTQHGYKKCFQKADQIYWLPTYLSREDPNLKILTPAELSSKTDVSVIISDLDKDLEQQLNKHFKNGDLILFLGAGGVDDWARQFSKNHQT